MNKALRLRSCDCAKKRQDHCPNRETQSKLRGRGGYRADHYFVSMVDLDEVGSAIPSDTNANISFAAMRKSTAAPSR
ncbi:hypothetical protein [Bradyrhizobium canariense]|uniref:hypothetical protein n=1 Tax=Bradyrhizobium canariense TaxID=255045 RepID=UPI001FCD3CAB|nr:hypothetical protein [Bradyrhizobium canariense]